MDGDLLRLLGTYSSEPEYAVRTGGVGAARHFLFSALGRRFGSLDLFQPPLADPRLDGTLPPTEHRTLKRSTAVFEAKSRATEAWIDGLDERPDAVFQWELFFAPRWERPATVPYFVYNDWTTRLAQRLMPGWADGDAFEPFHALQVPLLQGAAHVFAFSDVMRASVIEDYGVAPANVTTVHTGINFDAFPPAPNTKDFGPRRVLFVGNDYEAKGLPLLLEAFASVRSRFPDAELDVVGHPGAFDASAHPLGGVTIHGSVADKAELKRLFARATVFALPSRMEAFGHVYAEAMAFGLPCLGNDRSAVPEIITDGVTGNTCRPDGVRDWTEKLEALLASADERSRMGRAGYGDARERFSWDTVTARMATIIAEAV